ncbi:MAG: hemin receptor, partial [Bacteroidaceae bacterium]|nr:hemin receptor [Bacteroidaceae bacterium]
IIGGELTLKSTGMGGKGISTDAALNLSGGTTPITISRDGVVEVNNWTGSQVDYLYYNTLMPEYDRLTETTTFYSYNAAGYGMYRKRSGYIGNYDILVSGNVKDRVYWGVSATIADVRYDNNSDYTESLVLQDKTSIGSVTIKDQRIIRGTGFNIKAGVIFRPIEANPFRIGLSVETPTWYNLRTENRTDIYNDTNYGWNDKGYISETYNYSIATPWKFGVSLGTTIGTIAALGVSYNVADYSSSKSRIRTGSVYDRWSGTYYTTANNDGVMNGHTDWALRTVHTVKVGAEVKPSDMIALRVGYNYVSPMYMENAYRDVALNSPGTYYASTTDYTNWKDTHRITAGLGIGFGKFSVDLAYQYSMTKGVFMPYPKYNNEMTAPYGVEVKNNRHQMNCTLGYKF